MEEQKVIFTNDVNTELSILTDGMAYDKLYILVDNNTRQLSLPLIDRFTSSHPNHLICIGANDSEKNIESLSHIWMELSQSGATRKSLLINLGGGMITDIGGFAAASFKRGIRFINVPTSLLGAVDASVGGKTGINFNGLKNEVGAFAPALAVVISTEFFASLDKENLLSGYAEMLKHGLLSSKEIFNRLLNYDITNPDLTTLLSLLEVSVNVKREVVRQDPTEKGLRKALNLGHTVGHAFESYCLRNDIPVLHGYAVAWGFVCELILSNRQCGFPSEILSSTARYVRDNYGPLNITCKQYDELYGYMTHDKKNDSGFINFTLLKGIGEIELDQTASRENIDIMLDIYRDLMGI